jgi:hypothetical protein
MADCGNLWLFLQHPFDGGVTTTNKIVMQPGHMYHGTHLAAVK